jgi:predicted CXXCH cytochrome family protein
MNCHAVTRTDREPIKKLAAIYADNRPLAWQRVYTLPDHVYFDHRPHVRVGIACQTCHGEVQTMERVSREMSLRIGRCLNCHRDAHAALPAGSKVTEGPTNCFACHR